MFLGRGLLPYGGVDLREEGIRLRECVVDMRDIEFVREGQELPLDRSASDDEGLVLVFHHL